MEQTLLRAGKGSTLNHTGLRPSMGHGIGKTYSMYIIIIQVQAFAKHIDY